jgi:hypothetical protein
MKLKESTKTEIVRWVVIFVLLGYSLIVYQSMAQEFVFEESTALKDTKTKDQLYVEKQGYVYSKELNKDKTATTNIRIYEVYKEGKKFTLITKKEKIENYKYTNTSIQ